MAKSCSIDRLVAAGGNAVKQQRADRNGSPQCSVTMHREDEFRSKLTVASDQNTTAEIWT